MNNNSQRPIFLVGCPSSGTTLFQSIINAHSNLSCGPETDFLIECQKIVEGNYWKKLKYYGFEKAYWYERIADFFSSFKIDYAQKQGNKRWVDKTPCYTAHLEFICAVFPNCQIVHVIRDARDVVKSHQKRWGYKSAVKATYLWPEYIKVAREFGKTLPAEQYIEIQYEDMVREPEITAKSMFNYLQEPWEPEVLQYDKSSRYNKNSDYAKYTEERREKNQEKSLIYSSQVGKGKKLDPLLGSLLHFQANALLKELGYV